MDYALDNEILIGSLTRPSFRYENPKIQRDTTRGTFSLDVLGNELAIDTFGATVRYNADAPELYAPVGKSGYMGRDGRLYLVRKSSTGASYLRNLSSGTPIWWLVEGAVMAKGYLSKTERVSRNMYRITAISGIGLLDTQIHAGGVYIGQTCATVLASIIGGAFAYTIDQAVASVQIYGWLPYGNARRNLHTLLFAVGAALRKGADGEYVVTFLGDSTEMIDVPSSRVALQGKTEYIVPADAAEITEHSFFKRAGDEAVTLFDNSDGVSADNLIVAFGDAAPVYDLATSGSLTIIESDVNYAVVSGVGVLTGKKYTHSTQIIRVGDGHANVRRVETNTLISFANSYNVGHRVLDYFSSAKTLDAKIMLDNEKPGSLLALRDSFGDLTNAYLTRMDVLVTSVRGAQCKLISGFVPGAGGNNFTERDFFAANGTWIAQKDGKIRIILVGGGDGGQGGYKGMDGSGQGSSTGIATEYFVDEYDNSLYLSYSTTHPEYTQRLAVGGAAGAVGKKARFYVIDVDVIAGTQISLSVGAGGLGGAAQGVYGSAGSATTATITPPGEEPYEISSDMGSDSALGYYDPATDTVYAAAGLPGYKGGDGGMTDIIDTYAWHGEAGLPGQSVGAWRGGAAGAGVKNIIVQSTTPLQGLGSGGGGGGAAYGADGQPGGSAVVERVSGYLDRIVTGYGGWGANAAKPPKPAYGCGGAGGNGGGGGGSLGGGWVWTAQYFNPETLYDPTLQRGRRPAADPLGRWMGGKGGAGSQGGDGGDGCAIILS